MLHKRFSKIALPFIAIIFPILLHAQDKVYFDRAKNMDGFEFPTDKLDALIQPARYNAFFYGETHTRYFEPAFKAEFIKYLNERYGVCNVFMEIGYSAAVLFNQYLATGDTGILNFKVLYTTRHYKEMWKELYAYNRTLPAEKKIKIYGFDFEIGKTLFSALLALKLPDHQVPSSLEETFKKIEQFSTDTTIKNDNGFSGKVKWIKKAFAAHENDAAIMYGANMTVVNKMLNNSIGMMDLTRERKMGEHMQTEIKENHIDKFVAFFGGDHINATNSTALPNVLKQDKTFAGKTLNIRMICFDANDNWSGETLECIGVYDEKQGHILHQAYSDSDHRAVIIPDEAITQHFLKGSADYYLFANDK